MANPFAGYGRVVTGSRLVGRKVVVERLVDRLANSLGSYSIVGEPRIGKSSLVEEVFCRVKLLRPQAPIVSHVCSAAQDPKFLFDEILDSSVSQLRRSEQKLPESLSRILDTDVKNTYDAFLRCRDGLEELRGLGGLVYLRVEEFDAARRYDQAATVISCLRELLYKPQRYGLCAVIESRRTLRSIEKQVRDVSILDGICEKEFLRPLERSGLEEMVARCETWIPSEVDIDLLWDSTGGHPWLAEMILCRAWDTSSMHLGFESSVCDIFSHYEHLRDLLTEEKLFEQLIQIAVGPNWSIRPGAAELLCRYGILHKDTATGAYIGWSQHFQAYLERCTRETPIWQIWAETETLLRAFVEDALFASYGESWEEAVVLRHKSLESVFKDCNERKAQEKKKFGLAASERLLDYSYPMDLWSIISHEWTNGFHKKLRNSKIYWNVRFEMLSRVRTPAAHNRAIPASDVSIANGYCQELYSVLSDPADPEL